MQSLKCLDGWQSAPVDGVDMPYGNRAHNTTDAVPKQTNGDSAQDDGGGAQRQVVEEVLGGENLDAGGSIGGRCRRDGAHGVLLESPGAGIYEFHDRNPPGRSTLAALGPPPGLKLVTAWEGCSPCLAEEVGDKDNKSTRDGNGRGFKLGENACVSTNEEVCRRPALSTHCVNLAHDGLKTGQTGCEDQAAKGQGRIKVIAQGQEMAGGVGTGDDDNLVAASTVVVLFVVAAVSFRGCRPDLVVSEGPLGIGPCGTHDDLLLVGGGVGGDGEDLPLDGV